MQLPSYPISLLHYLNKNDPALLVQPEIARAACPMALAEGYNRRAGAKMTSNKLCKAHFTHPFAVAITDR